MDISRIDPNLASRPVDENGFCFHDVHEAPFSLEGLAWKEANRGAFYRLPPDLAPPVILPSDAIRAHHTALFAARVRTNSP